MSTSADRARRSSASRASRAAVLAAVIAGVLALAPAATADPTPVGIGVARTDPAQHGSFDVPVWTDAASATVASVTATVDDAGSPVTTVELTEATKGHWSPAHPLELTEDGGALPHLGLYPIDVTATDTAGNTVTRTAAGTLDFTLTPQFAMLSNQAYLLPSRELLTFDHHDLSVRGQVEGVQPGSGDLVPLVGATVTVVRSYDQYDVVRPADVTWTLETGSTGAFATPTTSQIDSASYTATVTEADAEVHGTAQVSNGFGPTLMAAAVTAATDRKTVSSGHRVTISGTVHRGSAKGAGLGGVSVLLGVGSQHLVVTTDGAGHFRGAVLALEGEGGGWSATAQSPFLQPASAQGQVTVPAQAHFTGARIALGSNAQLAATARLVAVHLTGAYDDQLVRLQYSRNGRTDWRTLTSVRSQFGSVALHAPGTVDGFYRLYHPLSPQLDTTATTPVRLHRTITRLARLTTSPTSTSAGHTVTVAGTLQDYRSGGWHAMARRTVQLFFLPAGSKRWAYLGSGSTAVSGHIALHGKATKTGRWLIKYFGDSTHFDTFAPSQQVTVH